MTVYETIAPTEAGFDATSVMLHDGRLRIEGQRVVVTLPGWRRIAWVTNQYSGKITIEVKGTPGEDFGRALDAILSTDPVGLFTPFHAVFPQQPNLAKPNSGPIQDPVPASNTATTDSGPIAIGGSVHPPKLLSHVDPVFSEAARDLKYSATVQVYLWVNEDGTPSHLKVVRPAGMGLDEQALAAVRQYRFAPATKDGKPVKSDIYTDVNFQIF